MATLASATPILLLIVIFVLCRLLIYPWFFSPLARIPNAHWTSPLTSTWIESRRRSGSEVRTVYRLHKKHGPIVRLGPNELSVNSLASLRVIYTGGFEGHRWYRDNFENFGRENLVSMLRNAPHSARKRILRHVYSKSYVQHSVELAIISRLVLRRLLKVLEDTADSNQAVDIAPLMHAVGMDISSAYVLGSAVGTDFVRNATPWARWLQLYAAYKITPPGTRVDSELEIWCRGLCEKTGAPASQSKLDQGDPDTAPVVYRQLSRALEETISDPHERARSVASEMLDQLIAGQEPSGVVLTCIIWELSRRAGLQERLRVELGATPCAIRDPSAKLPFQGLDNMPLLGAIVYETLRIHPPVAGLQPRVTPSSIPVVLEGFHIPGGVKVSSSTYTLHRDPEVYSQPEVWSPDRWLEAEKKQGARMRRQFWAFGSGPRMCLGNHFALQQIKLVIAAIYSSFETAVVDETEHEHLDAYVALLAGKVMVSFRRLKT